MSRERKEENDRTSKSSPARLHEGMEAQEQGQSQILQSKLLGAESRKNDGTGGRNE